MGIRFKTRMLMVKLKAWWRTSRYKKLEWKVNELDRVHNGIAESLTLMIQTQTTALHERLDAAENEKDKLYFLDKEFRQEFSNENRLRKSQATKLLKKLNECLARLDKNIGESNENFKFINDKIKKLDEPIKKIEEMDNLASMMRKELTAFRKLNEKLEILDGIHEKAKVDYDRYLNDLTQYHKTHIEMLHRDISEYKKNDNAVIRLSSLESRITMLELNHKEKVMNASNIHPMENRFGS